MDEILQDFKDESKDLVEQLLDILDSAEEGFEKKQSLEEYGQIVDRIMGGAKSVAMATDSPMPEQIGTYAELCKIVGYKGSQISTDGPFYTVVVAFLQDATEMLELMIDVTGTPKERSIKEILNKTFLDRLKWISEKFEEGLRASVATKADGKEAEVNEQADIDAILKQLGLG
jgi:hypothetical protein